MKTIFAIIGAVSLVVFVGLHLTDTRVSGTPAASAAFVPSTTAVSYESSEMPVPADQNSLIETVESFCLQYQRAPNEFQKSAVRRNRSIALQRLLGDKSIAEWIGTIDSMTTTGEGNGTLSIKLTGTNRISIKTWNNQLSDIGSNTLIAPNSPVYSQVATLAEGQKIKFSGTFLLGRLDYLQESSLTENGSMTSPEFIFFFTNVSGSQSSSPSKTTSEETSKSINANEEVERPDVTKSDSSSPSSLPSTTVASDTTTEVKPLAPMTAVSQAESPISSPRP